MDVRNDHRIPSVLDRYAFCVVHQGCYIDKVSCELSRCPGEESVNYSSFVVDAVRPF